MDGFVSNECGLFRFLDELMAAAAAIPTGPEIRKGSENKYFLIIDIEK
jgi:hypothetical protein